MTIPSNTIPTTILQLPEDPSPSDTCWLICVNNGVTYKVQASAIVNVTGVPSTRTILAGAGLTGGGDLSENRTLAVAVGGIGSTQLDNTGVAAGTYGTTTEIPVMTVDANGRVTAMTTTSITITGYVPNSRQVIAGTGLTGGGALNNDVTLYAVFSDATPLAVGTATPGIADIASRGDHVHPAINLADLDQTEGVLDITRGGTGTPLTAPPAGGIAYSDGASIQISTAGSVGQVLASQGTGAPSWAAVEVVAPVPANTVRAGPTTGADADPTYRALVNADLPASGVSANTYGSTTAIPVLTVNAKGVITSATTAAITGALTYQGTWNATTNVPTLASSTGTQGYYYVVSVAGSTNLNGITDWQVGDWAIYNGTAWQKIDNTDAVSSVNGQTGTVVLTYSDVGAQVAGTYVTSVSGTAPVASSGGTTPAISMAKATGSVDGYLSSTDWNTFNNKGSGNVVGPSSATDNAITRYDTTTGKLIQNSTVTIDDNGNIDQANAITFDITPATLPTAPGSLYWDNADGNQTLSLVMEGNHATQQIGEEIYYRIKASSVITEGQVIMFTGTVGASGGLTGAPATGLTAATASYVMGVATQDIPLNDWGYITQFGLVRQINTTGGAEAWVDGQILYLDPTVAGGLTKTLPTAPNPKVQVCAVVYATSNGSLFIRPTFGGEFGQYEGDVGFTSVAAGNLIRRNAGNTAWENVTTIPNTNLANSAITVGTTAISLGSSSTTLAGLTSVSSTSFTGALTGNSSTATTLATARNIAGVSFNGSADIAIPLSNLSDALIASPAVDQILKYNGSAWVNGNPNSISGGSGIEFFNATPLITATGTNNALQILSLSQSPVTTAEQTTSTTSINGTIASSAWLSPALGRTTIDAGIWDYTVFASASGTTTTITRQMYSALPFVTGTVTTTGTGTSRTATASAGTPFATAAIDASATNTVASYLQTPQGLYQITARASDTSITITTPPGYANESAVAGTVWKLLFGGLTTPSLTATIAQYDMTITQPAFTITALTKLGGITFVTSTNAGRTVVTTYNGTTRNTHISTPLAVLHNQLGGLQGGSATENYHLTDAEYIGSGTGVFARVTSPVFVTPALGTPSSGTLTNCTFPTLNQDTTGKSAKTDALNSATTVVNVSSATAPTTGQVLTATGASAATWQTPAGATKAYVNALAIFNGL